MGLIGTGFVPSSSQAERQMVDGGYLLDVSTPPIERAQRIREEVQHIYHSTPLMAPAADTITPFIVGLAAGSAIAVPTCDGGA